MLKCSRPMVAISVLAVIAAAIAGKANVPLYDGVNFPDEPYRYADLSHRPATALPSSPSVSFTPQDIKTYGLSLTSTEQGPQVAVYIAPSAIHLSSTVRHGTMTVQALAPTNEPAGGAIAGNVYRISGTVDSGSFTISASGHDTFNSIQLRLPQGAPAGPVIEVRPPGASSWHRLATNQVGNDIYESTADSFGDYALVTMQSGQEGQTAQPKVPRRKPPYIAIGLVSLIVCMGIVVAIIRFQQRPAQPRE